MQNTNHLPNPGLTDGVDLLDSHDLAWLSGMSGLLSKLTAAENAGAESTGGESVCYFPL